VRHGVTKHPNPAWESLSLEELERIQGVKPVTDLDEISALWPADDDPDLLLEHVIHERRARRGTMGKGGTA
jgi:hypothetical protein